MTHCLSLPWKVRVSVVFKFKNNMLLKRMVNFSCSLKKYWQCVAEDMKRYAELCTVEFMHYICAPIPCINARYSQGQINIIIRVCYRVCFAFCKRCWSTEQKHLACWAGMPTRKPNRHLKLAAGSLSLQCMLLSLRLLFNVSTSASVAN